jgi:hypothetical protein
MSMGIFNQKEAGAIPMIRTTGALFLVAGPAAAHVADAPHVHSEYGAVLVGVALIALAGGAALIRARNRRK